MKIISKYIEKRLGGYKKIYNNIDLKLPLTIQDHKKVAIIGSGLAGISAANTLAKRGFDVYLFEKNKYILGKVGAWKQVLSDGSEEYIEHGYHGFFRQYYNLRKFLEEIGSFQYLIPLNDYLIKNRLGKNYSFAKVNKIPILNLNSLLWRNKFNLRKILTNPGHSALLKFLKYEKSEYYKKYDDLSLEQFAKVINMDDELKTVFITFARAFFSKPDKISMAELFRASHFYFTGNDKGLLYDVMNDDYSETLIKPILKHFKFLKIKIFLNKEIQSIQKNKNKFIISNEIFDYLIIAADIPGTKKLINGFVCKEEKELNMLKAQMKKLKTAPAYAVLRIWIDKDISEKYPFCIMPNNYELDLVAAYHRIEKSSNKLNIYIFELHSYATTFKNEAELRAQMLNEFEKLFPEVKGYKILKEFLQIRENFTAFEIGLYKNRPECQTVIKNLFFAGDWVKLEIPAMLMEGAFSSGMAAANLILKDSNLQEEPIYTVPLKGIMYK